MWPPAPASRLLHSLLQRLASQRGRPSPGLTQGARMCSRPRLPALIGASLCWGSLMKTWDASTLMSHSLLRTRRESKGGYWAVFTLTGALVLSGHSVRLQEDVGPHTP